MSKNLILHSGGSDSLACMLDYIDKYGAENIISLGFNYGQRHFEMENKAAYQLCDMFKIPRRVLDIPISQIGGCSLIDKSIPVTTDMNQQRSTVVPQRNAIFLMFAAAFAQENDCDVIVHGACREDHESYRDCRREFFESIEKTIQLGRTNPQKGQEYDEDILTTWGFNYNDLKRKNVDIHIETPLINEWKKETMARTIDKWGVDYYKVSYSCYNGESLSCGKCPACVERLNAFKANNAVDPIEYRS
jgi:7-cyano-7-deazaguanine synthase